MGNHHHTTLGGKFTGTGECFIVSPRRCWIKASRSSVGIRHRLPTSPSRKACGKEPSLHILWAVNGLTPSASAISVGFRIAFSLTDTSKVCRRFALVLGDCRSVAARRLAGAANTARPAIEFGHYDPKVFRLRARGSSTSAVACCREKGDGQFPPNFWPPPAELNRRKTDVDRENIRAARLSEPPRYYPERNRVVPVVTEMCSSLSWSVLAVYGSTAAAGAW